MRKGSHHSEDTRIRLGDSARIAWMNPETRRRSSIAQKNKIVSLETRSKLSAAGLGHVTSENTKMKIRLAKLGHAVSDGTREAVGALRRGKTYEQIYGHSKARQIKNKMSIDRIGNKFALGNRFSLTPEQIAKISGSNSSNWLGGISRLPYGPEFDNRLKAQIRDRDGHICQLCNAEEGDRKHPVHHIDYNKKHNWPGNLTELCIGCNSKVNSYRASWKEYFGLLKRSSLCEEIADF